MVMGASTKVAFYSIQLFDSPIYGRDKSIYHCNSLITEHPMSRIYNIVFFLSRHSWLTLGLRSQFPSIVEQINNTPSRPGLGW